MKDDNFSSAFTEDDQKYINIIHPGKSKDMDLLIDSLQIQLKKKGGLLASISETGQELGMQLTRAAFSVMIKFAGLLETVDSLVDSLDMEEMTGNIPSEKGPERNTAIVKVLDGVAGNAEVAKCWANAT